VVLQRPIILLFVVGVGVEHHRAGVGAEVALNLVANTISLDIFAEVKELDVQGLHRVDGLHPGPLTQVLLVRLVALRVLRVVFVVRVLYFLLEEGEDGALHACGQGR
jgi:hypothetical protein